MEKIKKKRQKRKGKVRCRLTWPSPRWPWLSGSSPPAEIRRRTGWGGWRRGRWAWWTTRNQRGLAAAPPSPRLSSPARLATPEGTTNGVASGTTRKHWGGNSVSCDFQGVPVYMDRIKAAARCAFMCFRSAGGKLIIVMGLWPYCSYGKGAI